VPVDVLADGLWPDADETRARSSLRTAVAQLRRVLGADAVERVAAGLVLSGCWVDAPAYLQLADEVDRHLRAARYAEAFAAALEADALYVADMVVGEGAPAALVEHANALSTLRHRLLGDAAEAALEMGWVRDAVDFARRLREVDGVSERASRVLMLGHAATGEVHHALAEYERIREVLAEELGVDPSPQTRAAHLEVLQPVPSTPVEPPFVGRASELHWLSTVLDDVRRTPGATPVVVLSGGEGSGRHRLAVTACEDDGLAWADVQPGQSVRQAALRAQGKALLWRPDPTADAAQLGLLASGAEPLEGPAVLLALLPSAGELPAVDEVLRDAAVRSLQLQPLLLDDVAALVQRLLSGSPLPSLIAELHHLSGGHPGRVLELLREWRSSGRLTATSRGLALAPRTGVQEQDPSGRRALARALPRLEGDALEALQLSALLDQAVTPALLVSLLAEPGLSADDATLRARATAALEQLVDLGLLRTSPAGAVWRHPLLRDAVRAWMRPAVTQRLHRRIAGQAPMSSAARVEHWLAAGERELACVAALEAAAECSSRGDHAGARTHLLEVCSLGDLPEASADDRVDLFESLGDACAALRRPEEARAAYTQALDLALAALLPSVSRLRRKLEGVSDPRSLEVGRSQSAGDDSSVLSGLGVLAADTLDLARLEDYLKDVVEEADRRHDQRRAVGGRLQMAAAVCLPRRDFRAAHQWVEAALALDARPAERLRAVVVRHVTAVLLGGAATARTALRDAAVAAEAAGEEALQWRLLGMRVLVAHDLGDPDFEALWRRLEQRVTSGSVDEMVPELAAIGLRVVVEREELDRATTMSAHLALAGGQSWPLLTHLARLASSELAEGVGDHRQAADLLRSVVDEGLSTGCTLFVPEAAARLVVLEAEHDRAAARSAFEVYDEVVGATVGGPREEFWRRLSRAAVRASHGDAEGAAAACGQASSLAAKHGLQVLAARARHSRTDYLRATGFVPSRRGDESRSERNAG
jgi:DNA-binding SARP family transcriptional activator